MTLRYRVHGTGTGELCMHRTQRALGNEVLGTNSITAIPNWVAALSPMLVINDYDEYSPQSRRTLRSLKVQRESVNDGCLPAIWRRLQASDSDRSARRVALLGGGEANGEHEHMPALLSTVLRGHCNSCATASHQFITHQLRAVNRQISSGITPVPSVVPCELPLLVLVQSNKFHSIPNRTFHSKPDIIMSPYNQLIS